MHCARGVGGTRTGAQSRPAGDVDKREVTILHCDVDAAVRIGRAIDLESYHEFVQSVLACIRRAVRQHRLQGDDSHDRNTGDSVLFCFGLPRASEDDAVDAVSAALSALAAARALPVPAGITPEFRIGVATGAVVLSVTAGADEARAAQLTGVAPNLAARLQSVAPGGSVAICDATRAIIARRFACEALGEFELKGLGLRRAWRVLEHLPSHALPDAAPEVPWVGRATELAKMLDRWRAACLGEPAALLVRGEPGVGKSRLLQEFETRISGDDVLVMDVRCARAHRDTAFHAIADCVERLFRLPPAGPDGAREARLGQILVDRLGLAAEDLPEIAGFLSPAGIGTGTLSAADAKARRDAAMRSMIALFHEQVRGHRAAAVFIEDVQWADPSSLEFLGRVIREAGSMRLLAVFSARPEFEPGQLAGLRVDCVELGPLTRAQSAVLLGKIDTGNRIPPGVAEIAVEKCDGIPLYLCELTRSLLDRARGGASPDRQEADLLDALNNVPKTLRGLLNARLDRSPAARGVAQVAAVIGREFPLALLRAVAPMPDGERDRGLRELSDAHLIVETTADRGVCYAFRHALLQDVAYDSLLDRPRRELHARIADVLAREAVGPTAALPAVIARHYTEARLPRPGIRHWVRASRHAAERSGSLEAAAHLYRAIALAATLDDPGEAAEQELELRARLVPPLLAAHGYASDEVARNAARAVALFPRARAAEPKIVILRTDCSWAIVRGDLRRAAGLTHEITRLATQIGESSLALDARLLSGLVDLYRGRLRSARENLAQCRATYRPDLHAEYSARQGVDIASAAPAYLSRVLWLLGDARAAEQLASEAVARAAASPIPLAETQAQGMKMLLHLAAGDISAVRHSADRTRELARRRGQVYWVGLVSVVSAWLESLPAATSEAVARLDRSLDDYRATGSRLGLSWLLLLRADAEHRAGYPESALATTEEALDFARDSDELYYLPELLRVRAKLLWLASGRPDRALEALDRAVLTAGEQGAVAWRAKAAETRSSLARAGYGTAPPPALSLLLP